MKAEIERLVGGLNQCCANLEEMKTQALLGLDLSQQQAKVLSFALVHESLSNTDVCELLSLTKGTVSGLLKRLIERNLLLKDDSKKRNLSYRLSDEGQVLAEKWLAEENKILQAFAAFNHAEIMAWQAMIERVNGQLASR